VARSALKTLSAPFVIPDFHFDLPRLCALEGVARCPGSNPANFVSEDRMKILRRAFYLHIWPYVGDHPHVTPMTTSRLSSPRFNLPGEYSIVIAWLGRMNRAVAA
jgi:hypothetical protein